MDSLTKTPRYIRGKFIAASPTGAWCTEERRWLELDGEGLIVHFLDELPENWREQGEALDYGDQLIIPAFTDLHLHAPQFGNCGLGYDLPLLPWLERYTFPEEARYTGADYAQRMYGRFVLELLRAGSLDVAVYASLHVQASLGLAQLMEEAGLAGLVGKVQMDRNGAPGLEEESAEASYEATLAFLESFPQSERLFPVLTPRFAPSCSPQLLDKLGQLAEQRGLAVQSHINENPDEIAWVAELFPERSNYLEVYQHYGLCPRGRSILAHAIHNQSQEERAFLSEAIHLTHCPRSNMNLSSGMMPAARFFQKGQSLSIASDIAGGDQLFMPQNIISAVQMSKLRHLAHPDEGELSLAEAFYLATHSGRDYLRGCRPAAPQEAAHATADWAFAEGRAFTALVIDDGRFVERGDETVIERLEKFLYRGQASQILERYQTGRRLDLEAFESGLAG